MSINDWYRCVIKTTGPGTLTLGMNVIVVNGQLQKLDLTDDAFQNANVSIIASRHPDSGGDGHVNVGVIDATDNDLGAVTVDGDLGRIDAGSVVGVTSLKVGSLGRMGTTTGATDLVVLIAGRLGTLRVAGDVVTTFVAANSLGSATIGGSFFGGVTGGDGSLQMAGDMGPVKVGGDLIGGTGNDSGAIRSGGAIASVTVGGSLLGGNHPGGTGTGFVSGAIVAGAKLGPVKIGHDVRGFVGVFSGAIISSTQIVSVNIGGSLIGSRGAASGIITSVGLLGPVTIKGDIIGGGGNGSGVIDVNQDITSVTVGGSLIGGFSPNCGLIQSRHGVLGPVKIGGDFRGGSDLSTGTLFAQTRIVSVDLGGSLIGGHKRITSDDVDDSGRIHSDGAIGPVTIGGDIVGGEGTRTGWLDAATTLGNVTIGGSLRGGDGDFGDTSGIIASGGAMGFIRIGHDIRAGRDERTGQIESGGTLAGVTLGGSLIGDATRSGFSGSTNIAGQILSVGAMGPVKIAGDVIGGSVSQTGRISSMSTIASVTIGGSLLGNSSLSAEILSAGAMGPVKIGGDIAGSGQGVAPFENGYIEGQRIASLFVGGSIRAGVDIGMGVPANSGSVRAADDIGPITIMGSLVGSIDRDGDPADGDFKPAIISARGKAGLDATATTDVAIKSIKIAGRMEMAQILAGFSISLAAQNADAQIGAITIGGDIITSSIVAGVSLPAPTLGTSAKLGLGAKDNLDDIGAVSKIASVVIKGGVFGTAATNDPLTFAIASQQLGKLTVGGTAIPFTRGASNDLFALSRHLGATLGATTDGFDFHAFEI